MTDENPLNKLPDSQVFDRDPADWTPETLEEAKDRLAAIVARLNKLRDKVE